MMKRTTLGALVLLLSACSVLEPQPDDARYFVLRPVDADAATGPALSNLILGVGPTSLADYLDRIDMIESVGPYEVRYSSSYRWIEPLGTQLERVLTTNLVTLLRPAAVHEFPWFEQRGVQLQVEVDFDALLLTTGGGWQGSAEWAVRDAESGRILDSGSFDMAPVQADAMAIPEAIAGTLSDEVARLSIEIAAAVRRNAGS